MAILDQGLVGIFRGKMGAIVVAKWKDLYVGKSKSKRSTKPASVTQIEQRAKFGLVGKFIKAFPELVQIGFKSTGQKTSMNQATSYNLSNAVKGAYPNYSLDYSKIALSDSEGRDLIDEAESPVMVAAADQTVKVTWKAFSVPSPLNEPTDTVYLVLHNPVSYWFSLHQAIRSSLNFDFRVSRKMVGEVHGWLIFASVNKKYVTGTQYLGKVTVIA